MYEKANKLQNDDNKLNPSSELSFEELQRQGLATLHEKVKDVDAGLRQDVFGMNSS